MTTDEQATINRHNGLRASVAHPTINGRTRLPVWISRILLLCSSGLGLANTIVDPTRIGLSHLSAGGKKTEFSNVRSLCHILEIIPIFYCSGEDQDCFSLPYRRSVHLEQYHSRRIIYNVTLRGNIIRYSGRSLTRLQECLFCNLVKFNVSSRPTSCWVLKSNDFQKAAASGIVGHRLTNVHELNSSLNAPGFDTWNYSWHCFDNKGSFRKNQVWSLLNREVLRVKSKRFLSLGGQYGSGFSLRGSLLYQSVGLFEGLSHFVGLRLGLFGQGLSLDSLIFGLNGKFMGITRSLAHLVQLPSHGLPLPPSVDRICNGSQGCYNRSERNYMIGVDRKEPSSSWFQPANATAIQNGNAGTKPKPQRRWAVAVMVMAFFSMAFSMRFYVDGRPKLIKGTIFLLFSIWLVAHAIRLFDPEITLLL